MTARDIPTDGLLHPRDLEAWRRWQHTARTLGWARTLMSRVTPGPAGTPEPLHLAIRGTDPAVLLAVDAVTPTQLASVLAPLAALPHMDMAVLSVPPSGTVLRAAGEDPDGWECTRVAPAACPPERVRGIRAAVGVGHYLAAGAAAHRWACAAHARFVVVQHGLLTPYAPPLPDGAHVLAFTADDARFLTSGRPDVTWQVTGSQLLWHASRAPRGTARQTVPGPPVFLGQLHGAELPRSQFARAAAAFCRATGAHYRPHPGERDKLSRAQHGLWRASGISVDDARAPLQELNSPVAAVFSTGVLEAAARGLPARVTHPAPPPWLEAFWRRYGMVRWNGTARGAGLADDDAPATPAPSVPEREPAVAVAGILAELCGTGNPRGAEDPRGREHAGRGVVVRRGANETVAGSAADREDP